LSHPVAGLLEARLAAKCRLKGSQGVFRFSIRVHHQGDGAVRLCLADHLLERLDTLRMAFFILGQRHAEIDQGMRMIGLPRQGVAEQFFGDSPVATTVADVAERAKRVRVLGIVLPEKLIFLFRTVEIVAAEMQ